MFRIPSLEYGLSHPHPRGQLFMVATLVIFLLTLPVLILVNLVTLGSELVPTLQPHFQPDDILLSGWWGTRRLPSLFRPRAPKCEPKDLGRGDIFRLTGSLFDYTVMSTWNTSAGTHRSGLQEQKRAEYRGQSFADCVVNTVRFDYSLFEQSQSVMVSVVCPGTPDYPIYVSMQTTMTFAWELSKDFIGQYWGPGLDFLDQPNPNPRDFRMIVLAALQVISTDSLTIMRKPNLSNNPGSMTVVFNVTEQGIADPMASTLTYANGSQPDAYPQEAFIYLDTVTNLVYVAIDAVNLDLGNNNYPTMFTNTSRLVDTVYPNPAPPPITPANWAEGSKSFYYGNLTAPYQTWADQLLHGVPVQLGNANGMPEESEMATAYLCPSYQVKPLSSLLTSVFVGSATMTLSVWGVWMFFTAFVAKRISEPLVLCGCKDCKSREEKRQKDEADNTARPGMLTRLKSLGRRAKPSKPGDEEKANPQPLSYVEDSEFRPPAPLLDERHLSYRSDFTTEGK